ncbi:olfactory receptor 6M1-like [Genypterus blacodes]|uniref:olfactory receptor 6M1-like n=1 Tax=Genypterus blacodes TaxID=154954 RepID=UPI003F763316
MARDFNVTYITLDGYVELEKYRFLYFVIMFTVYILIICSNFTIVCLIWIHKNLHEPMYIFIAALLVNSVLYSTVLYPKCLIDFLSETQIVAYPTCLFQLYMFYTLGSSEYILLSVMAYDRYVSICKPLQYTTIMTKHSVSMLVSVSWLLPSFQLVGPTIISAYEKLCSFTFRGIFCNNSIFKLHCVPSALLSIYGIILMLNFILFPLIFILFSYTKIFIITYHSSREVRKKAAETCLPHLLVLINYSLFCAYDVLIVRVESNIPKTAHLIMTLQMFLYHPLFNPIIYGLKMTEISKHLKRLFCPAKRNQFKSINS